MDTGTLLRLVVGLVLLVGGAEVLVRGAGIDSGHGGRSQGISASEKRSVARWSEYWSGRGGVSRPGPRRRVGG